MSGWEYLLMAWLGIAIGAGLASGRDIFDGMWRSSIAAGVFLALYTAITILDVVRPE